MSNTASAAAGGPPRWRRAVMLITVISLLNSMASMIVVPVLPRLVQSFTGDAGHAAEYVGLFAATFALVQFFASPVLGSLSDAFGRRAVILISAFGLACDYSFMALAPSVGWLFVGRMISGVTAASAPAVNAYIADSIPPEERAGAFGWTGSAFAVGFLLGPALGGVLGAVNPRLPFWISAGLCLAAVAYGFFVLPESLPKARRTRFTFRGANPWSAVRFLIDRPQIRGLAATQGVMAIAAQCLPTTLVLYTWQRFHWSTAVSGPYLTYAGLGHLVVQSLIVKRMVGRFGERAAATVGFASTAIGFTIYASAPIGAIFAVGMPFYALAGLVGPSVQSQMTRLVAPTEQGRLQGTNASIASMVALFAPVMFTQLFKYASEPGHGLVPQGLHLYVGAAVLAAGAVLAFLTMHRRGVALSPPERPAKAPAASGVAAG